jgi:hypothetical protein
MLTRATRPLGLPKAPRIPVCNLYTKDMSSNIQHSTLVHKLVENLPIGTSARQHLVDTGDVERMDTDTHVEGVLTTGLSHILVTADTTSFKSFSGKLFIFVGDEMDAKREVIDRRLLTTKIVDSELGIGDTTAESALGVGLVLAVSITSCWTATHFELKK